MQLHCSRNLKSMIPRQLSTTCTRYSISLQKSIKQRLGKSNIKARLTLRGGRGGLRGSIRGMRSTRGMRGQATRGGRGR